MPIAVSGNDITLRRRHAYTRMRCTRVCPAESLGNNCLSGKEASWVSIELLWERTMIDQLIGAHNGLHSEQGSLSGEPPGRSANPVIKVHDVVWLEFEKPDLKKAEAFALAFGFSVALRTDDELHLRGSDPGAPCVLIRRGTRSRFVGPAFVAAEDTDLLRLADATGTTVRPLPETLGGMTVDLVDPSGIPLRVVSRVQQLAELPS